MTRAPDLPPTVFTDTGGYFAFANRRDANHERASELMERLVRERRRQTTTNFVVAEVHALLLSRVNRQVAAAALQDIYDTSTITVVRVTATDEARAREIIFGYTDKAFSLTDATSFAVMERLGLTHALTFDRNFAQYGFTMLPAPGGDAR